MNELFVLHKLETAGLGLGLATMFLVAGLNPEGNRAVVIGASVGLVAMAITELLSAHIVTGAALYPEYLIWPHALARLAIGGALLWCGCKVESLPGGHARP